MIRSSKRIFMIFCSILSLTLIADAQITLEKHSFHFKYMYEANISDPLSENPGELTVINIEDNDIIGSITESSGSTVVSEKFPTADEYFLQLIQKPQADVYITASCDPEKLMLTPEGDSTLTLVFSPAQWDSSRKISVYAVNDEDINNFSYYSISHQVESNDPHFNGFNLPDIKVKIIDNDYSKHMAKNFTIPIVDIDQNERQVVVDKREGIYLGHVATTLLEDSTTILATYPIGHGKGPIQYKKSLDGGLTWSDTLPTPKSWATSQEVPTLFRMTDPQGKERIILFSGLYPVRRASSEDNGETWTELEKVGEWGGIVVMGCAIRLKDGRYMALFHDDGRFFEGAGTTSNFKVYKTYTEDGGLTWSFPETIIDVDWADHCEPGIFRSPDGKQLLVLFRENSRKYNSHFITSNDEGETWSPLKEMPGALTGDRHTGRYGPDGRLFISFRDRGIGYPKIPTWGDWVGWIGTYDDIVNGREGQYRLRIKDNKQGADCAYPGVEILPDGTIVTTTYGHWITGEQPYIVSSRFKFDEIDSIATGF